MPHNLPTLEASIIHPPPDSASPAPSIDGAAVDSEIRRILVAELGVPPDRLIGIGPATSLLGQGLGLDSMEAFILVAKLERAFEFEAPDEELTVEAFATLGSLAERVVSWIARGSVR